MQGDILEFRQAELVRKEERIAELEAQLASFRRDADGNRQLLAQIRVSAGLFLLAYGLPADPCCLLRFVQRQVWSSQDCIPGNSTPLHTLWLNAATPRNLSI